MKPRPVGEFRGWAMVRGKIPGKCKDLFVPNCYRTSNEQMRHLIGFQQLFFGPFHLFTETVHLDDSSYRRIIIVHHAAKSNKIEWLNFSTTRKFIKRGDF